MADARARYESDPEYRQQIDAGAKAQYQHWLDEAPARAAETERQREAMRAEIAQDDRRQRWSTMRAAACIRRRLDKSGVLYTEQGNGSLYFRITAEDGERMELRVSDHSQPEYGGYKGFNPEVGDERHGASDVLCDPYNLSWREAWTEVERFITRSVPVGIL